MTLIALFLLSAGSGLAGPTTQEFAKALAEHSGDHVKVTDVRHLCCKSFGTDEPTEVNCGWQQRIGRHLKRCSTSLAVDGRGWHLTDKPSLKH